LTQTLPLQAATNVATWRRRRTVFPNELIVSTLRLSSSRQRVVLMRSGGKINSRVQTMPVM
jgi:hypothetical protein